MLFDFYDAKLIKNVTSYLKYLMKYMALGMRPDKFQSTGIDYRAILTDVVVIADTAEATATVIFLQFGHSQRTVFACGGTVNNDVIDCSHVT
jgi:hypothetical protein